MDWRYVESQDIAQGQGFTTLGPGLRTGELNPNAGTWRITIEHAPHPHNVYRVTSHHLETGAKMDDRMVGASLAKARDIAGLRATVIRGTMYDYDWRAGR